MNNTIFYFLYSFAHQSIFLDKVIVFLAVYFPYIVIFSAGVFLLMHHEVFKAKSTLQILLQKKKEILGAFFIGVLSYIFAYILKYIFHSPRPFDLFPKVSSLFPESGFAFPSGHASFFMALAVSIFLFHRKAGYVFMVFALIIGIARIAGGVHFPIDILGGFVLGGTVAYLIEKYRITEYLCGKK